LRKNFANNVLTSWVQLIGEGSVEEGMGQRIVGGVVIKGIGRCGPGSVVSELTEVKCETEVSINGSQGKVTDGEAVHSSVAWQTGTAGSLLLLPVSSSTERSVILSSVACKVIL